MLKVRPFLKWAGGKYRLIDKIINKLLPANRLVEPFTGSGAVFINSNYSKYLLAESNKDLIQLYSYLKENGEDFINYCEQFFCQQNNCNEQYYYFRNEFNQTNNQPYRSALFLYLNRHGYNGLCRYNQSGIFNVPFGRIDNPYFPRQEMHLFYEKSQYAEFIHNDFRETFAQAIPGDLIYCDPPYIPLSDSANFATYTKKVFTDQDHIELADLAKKTAKRGIPVIISNHDTDLARKYYKKSKIYSFPVKRFISCNGKKRCEVQELIAVFDH